MIIKSSARLTMLKLMHMVSPLILLLTLACTTPCRINAQTNSKSASPAHYKNLVWQDEFEQPGLPDPAKWKMDTGYLRNHELQYYTRNRMANASVHDGLLDIAALKDSLKANGHLYPVTSAALTTKGIKDWTYGRIEVRAKIPSSLGTWPAIWCLGADIDSTDWPACGEIDIMEHVGYMPDTLHFNVHTEKYNHVIHSNKGAKIYYPLPEKDFHTYAIEWFPGHIDWFFDGNRVFSFKNEHRGNAAWPFDKPQFIILNLAFGGDWGGSKGVNFHSLPQHFLIDYVRVYQ